jgi:hypothetical protein
VRLFAAHPVTVAIEMGSVARVTAIDGVGTGCSDSAANTPSLFALVTRPASRAKAD